MLEAVAYPPCVLISVIPEGCRTGRHTGRLSSCRPAAAAVSTVRVSKVPDWSWHGHRMTPCTRRHRQSNHGSHPGHSIGIPAIKLGYRQKNKDRDSRVVQPRMFKLLDIRRKKHTRQDTCPSLSSSRLLPLILISALIMGRLILLSPLSPPLRHLHFYNMASR